MARLIDADELIRQADENQQFAVWEAGVGTLVRLVDTMPTIDPESLRPTAQLVQNEFGAIKCKNCGSCVAIGGKNALHNAKREFRFCYNCGAKLEELKDADA